MFHMQDSEGSDHRDQPRRRRSDAPSPESPHFQQSSRGSKVIFSAVKWGNITKHSEEMTMYRKIACDNPYSRATRVLEEAMVDPLGVQMTRRYSESSLALFRPAICAWDGKSVRKENDIAPGCVSDWTDEECETMDCSVSTRRDALSRDMMWNLVCGHDNHISSL
ncbi:hypothetical protein F1880_006459 [Penicillium rolfsii]|nr:hypothetical protein F1880_006459 [Penicillium rolfsii]